MAAQPPLTPEERDANAYQTPPVPTKKKERLIMWLVLVVVVIGTLIWAASGNEVALDSDRRDGVHNERSGSVQ